VVYSIDNYTTSNVKLTLLKHSKAPVEAVIDMDISAEPLTIGRDPTGKPNSVKVNNHGLSRVHLIFQQDGVKDMS
jgi:hypothetical protein